MQCRNGALETIDLDATPGSRQELGRIALRNLFAVTEDDDAIAERLGLIEVDSC